MNDYIIIFIVLLFAYWIITKESIIKNGYNVIGGIWEADASFADDAEIDRFILYFEPLNKSHKKNICWILISTKTNILVNHMTTYKISTKLFSLNNISVKHDIPRHYNILFGDIPENIEEYFPKKQSLQLQADCCKIILSHGDKAFFVGYKDAKTSDIIDIE